MSLCRACLTSRLNLLAAQRLLHLSVCHSENHYKVLGVQRTASKEEVKAAFVALSKKYHPDLNPKLPSANNSFVEINEAYSILSNVSQRQQYDLELYTAERYRAQVFANTRANPAYAGSGPCQTGFTSSMGYSDSSKPFTYSAHYGYDFNEGEIDWEAYKQARRPDHTKVVISLIALLVIAAVVQSLRIHWAHKHFQERTIVDNERNHSDYRQLREKAGRSSVQDQLDLLSRQHSSPSLQKIAVVEENDITIR